MATAKTFINVNGNEVLLTNAVMMQLAIEALEETDASEVVIAKAKAHLAALTKKSTSAPAGPTKAQVENAAYAKKLLEIMPTDKAVSLEWVAGKFGFVATDGRGNKQKALQVMKVLLSEDKAVKVEGRPVTYKLA